MEDTQNPENAIENPVENPDEVAQIEEEKTLSELTIDVMKNIDFLIIPKIEKDIRLLYDTYKTSEETLKLLNEQDRTVFADVLLLEEPKTGIRKLYWMTIDIVASNFNGNAKEIDEKFDEVTLHNIWELVDVKLPILKTIEINSDIYWKRVFDSCSKNRLKVGQEITSGMNLSWKCLGLSERIRELFEENTYEGWIDEVMISMVQPIAKYIYHLRFTNLNPIQEHSYDRDTNLLDYRMINYDKDECHHINLEIVGELYQLRYLSFEFSPPKLGVNYHSRYFDFSTLDMIHLASGLVRLEHLTTFKIRNSRMNNKKLEILIDGIKSCPLENIDFSYCQLNDECGYTLSKLFDHNKQLQTMDISGNYIGAAGMSTISYGIQKFEGYLKYLNLARNPINDTGLLFLARAMNNAYQIEKLNICGIHITEKGCAALVSILQNTRLTNINMVGLPIGEILAEDIINSVDINRNLLKCEADECSLSLEQELKLRILIYRNNYIHENPYIDIEITPSKENLPEEEVRKIKNKIYLKALEMSNKEEECMEKLTEAFRNNLPNIDKQIIRYSKQVKEMLDEGLQPPREKIKKKSVRISEAKYFQKGDDPELEFVKHCVLAKTLNRGYFINED